MMREDPLADALSVDTSLTMERFNEAFNSHDVDAIMALMTEDCVFESTTPPDGERFEGQEAVRRFWTEFFRQSPQAHFEFDVNLVAADRCVVLWTYRWGGSGDNAGHVRGVDVFLIRDGKVAEKLSYVKG